jgi:hypothetical protein
MKQGKGGDKGKGGKKNRTLKKDGRQAGKKT